MVTQDDVAALVLARTAATSGFSDAVPGGAWYDRGPDVPTAYPYVVFKIEPGPVESFSGDLHLKQFSVRAAAYCPVGQSGVNQQTVQQSLNTALVSTAANAWFQAQALRNATDLCLHGLPAGDGGSHARELREGRDVFTPVVSVDLMFQSDGSVA